MESISLIDFSHFSCKIHMRKKCGMISTHDDAMSSVSNFDTLWNVVFPISRQLAQYREINRVEQRNHAYDAEA